MVIGCLVVMVQIEISLRNTSIPLKKTTHLCAHTHSHAYTLTLIIKRTFNADTKKCKL